MKNLFSKLLEALINPIIIKKENLSFVSSNSHFYPIEDVF